MRSLAQVALFLAAVGAVYLKSAPMEGHSGLWSPSGVMSHGRAGAAAVRMVDGRVLITGGSDVNGVQTSAELFGLGGSFSEAAPMLHGRSNHVAVALNDGRVLVTGGRAQGEAVLADAEIYDPDRNSWKEAGGMSVARVGHTATLLPDGRVLIAGGAGDVTYSTIEIFNPSLDQFSTVSAQLLSPRTRHGAAMLADGTVLLAGGSSGSETLQTTDVFDARTGVVSRGPDMLLPREDLTVTTLLDGRILFAGGLSGLTALASAEIYDPAASKFSLTSAMGAARHGHLAFLLPSNNRVLLVGGEGSGNSSELFVPWRGSFQKTGALQEDRAEATGAPAALEGILVLAGGRGRAANLQTSTLYRFATLRTEQVEGASDMTFDINGSGWQPGEQVRLMIRETPRVHEDRTLVAAADGLGNILSRFRPEGANAATTYVLTAAGSTSEGQLRFASTSGSLSQCANDSDASGSCLTSQDWVSGNLGASKASYQEGQSIPYRLVMGSVPTTGSHTVTIEWDTTKSSKHALDYLTSYNRTVLGASPCAGVSGCSAFSTFSIPADPKVTGAGVTPVAGVFTLFGGTITGVLAYTDPASYTGDTSTRVTITFTAAVSNPVLAWGGHIASHLDWGAGNAAPNISGSPFHMRLIELDGGGGNQDRSLSSDAVTFPASIALTKYANPSTTGASFSFTATAPLTTPFSLSPTSSSGASTSLADKLMTFASYTITEDVKTGWSVTDITCTVASGSGNGGSATSSLATRSATISVKEGEIWSCSFTNTQLATITVKKVMVGGTGSFDFTGDVNGTISANNGTLSKTNVQAGATYTSTESTLPTGWLLTSIACDDQSSANKSTGDTITRIATFKVDAGESITCTFTNTKQAQLTIKKTTDPTSDTTAFTFTPTGGWNGNNATFTQTNAQTGFGSGYLAPGTYGATEAVPTGWALTARACVLTGTATVHGFTSPANGVSVDLAAGEDVTCTFTDTKQAQLQIKKVTDPTSDTTAFTFTPTGGWNSNNATFTRTNADLAFPSGNLAPGTYGATETVPAGWALTARACVLTGTPTVHAFTPTTTGVSVVLTAGEDVTCTFTNTKQVKLRIQKATNPSSDVTTAFTFTPTGGWNGNNAIFMRTSAQAAFESEYLAPGTYGATETPLDGWNLTGTACVLTVGGGAHIFTTPTGGISIILAAGEDVTCTFTNTQVATLIIAKICAAAPTDSPIGGFAIKDGPNDLTTLTCGQSKKFTHLGLGLHSLSETAPGGTWNGDLHNWKTPPNPGGTGNTIPGTFTGDGCQDGNVTLAAGQTSYCYVLNVASYCTPTFPQVPGTPVNADSVGSTPANARGIRPARPGRQQPANRQSK